MMGAIFVANIAFSLQCKFQLLNKLVIRVPRDHCKGLIAALFSMTTARVLRVSGTIKGVQKYLH